MESHGGQRGASNTPSEEKLNRGPLRQPKEETRSRLLNSFQKDLNQNNNAIEAAPVVTASKFVLSADAPEFVPRFSTGPRHTALGSVNSEKEQAALSVSAPEFVPRQLPAYHTTQVVPQTISPQDMYEDPLINEFKRTLFILTTQPGNMEEYMRPLCRLFESEANSIEYLLAVCNLLYEQSVRVPNFRYTGARVCQHICSSLKNHHIFSQFRREFLKRCQADFEQRQFLISNQDGLQIICGLTLLMGELFLNMEVDINGRKEKMNFLPPILTDLLLTLISNPSDTTVKCAAQLLKLAGATIEDSLKVSQGTARFDEVFSHLSALSSAPNLGENIKFLVKTVLNLRQSNWGRRDSASSQSEGESFDVLGTVPAELVQNEPVFYNAYGQPISREEAGFFQDDQDDSDYILDEDEEQAYLEWQAENHGEGYPNWSNPDDQGYNMGYQYVQDEGAMTDEMDAAYEEFLRTQPHGGHH